MTLEDVVDNSEVGHWAQVGLLSHIPLHITVVVQPLLRNKITREPSFFVALLVQILLLSK